MSTGKHLYYQLGQVASNMGGCPATMCQTYVVLGQVSLLDVITVSRMLSQSPTFHQC
jgi:hypothetical protein